MPMAMATRRLTAFLQSSRKPDSNFQKSLQANH
jgi:hypothetical protein